MFEVTINRYPYSSLKTEKSRKNGVQMLVRGISPVEQSSIYTHICHTNRFTVENQEILIFEVPDRQYPAVKTLTNELKSSRLVATPWG